MAARLAAYPRRAGGRSAAGWTAMLARRAGASPQRAAEPPAEHDLTELFFAASLKSAA